MARYDVYTFDHPHAPLVVDVQADILSDLSTRVVIPLMPVAKAKDQVSSRLKPLVGVNGKHYVLITTDITVASVKDLKKQTANLDSYHRDITDAIDFLLQGF